MENYTQGFGTISFEAGTDKVFGRVNLGDGDVVTVRGTRDDGGFRAEGDGIVLIGTKRKDAKPSAPIAVVTISLADGELIATVDMWRPKTGTAFGLSVPRVTATTTDW